MPQCETCGETSDSGVWCQNDPVGDVPSDQINDTLFTCTSCYRMYQEIADIEDRLDLDSIGA